MPDDHLSRLLASTDAEPLYRSLARNIKELISPPKLPELDVTSRPVEVKDIWGLYARRPRSFAFSVAVQAAIVALVFTVLASKPVRQRIQQAIPLILPADVSPVKPAPHTGGGGGGNRSPLPASKGRLPKPAPRQFVPPVAVALNEQPKLAVDATILAPPDSTVPQVNLSNFGDPLAQLGPPSNGMGSGDGIGSGKGGGVGSGTGGGAGLGANGGIVYLPGAKSGVTKPIVIHQEDPEFSDEARKAHFQGEVIVMIEVDPTGHVVNPRIVKSAGLGLDEKSIEAALKWTFKPGTLNGKPVTTRATISMSFHLL